MKTYLIALIGWAGVLTAGAVQPGDTETQVREELGPPLGLIEINQDRVLMYDRGRVDITDGVVTAADLISEEELVARREREAIEREARAAELKELRVRRFREGTEIMTAKLDDPVFMTAPAAQRLAFWKSFRQSYPEVTMPTDYEVAFRERESELRTERAQQRVAELEREAANAERAAAEAEADLLRDRQRRESYVYRDYDDPYYVYPARYVSSSSCTCRHSGYGGCPLHKHEVKRVRYVPFESTPGYGYQRAKAGPPYIPTGRKHFHPKRYTGNQNRVGVYVNDDGVRGHISAGF